MSQPAVFVDRDGTLIKERGYLSDPTRVELISGAGDGVARLISAGFAVVVLSNQSGVARGLFSLADVERVNHRIRQLFALQGASLAGVYTCPHLPEVHDSAFGGICLCRKPYPGMALEAASVLELDLKHAFVVGDKLSDIGMANQLNVPGILVRTGYGRDSEFNLGRPGAPRADIVVPAIINAVDWILSRRHIGA